MWIFTTNGFISVVQSRIDDNHLIVRARRFDDLAILFPSHTPYWTADSDYPYRITVLRMNFVAVMLQQFANITYDNFKNAVPKGDYHDFLVQVWGRGLDYEDSESRVSFSNQDRFRKRAHLFSKRKTDFGGEQRSHPGVPVPPEDDNS